MLNRKGFTLIELMIVVVIIGILAAIAIPNFMAMEERAKEAKVKSNAHSLQLAAEDYAVRHDGIYATETEQLLPYLPKNDNNNYLQNAFTGDYTEPNNGRAASPGQISYQVLYQGGVPAGYTITGYGANQYAGPNGDGIVVTLDSSS